VQLALGHTRLMCLGWRWHDRRAPTVSQKLDPAKSTLVLCHHGVRSMQAAEYLVSQGFTNVSNVTGGIDRYTTEADPSVPRY
jgi:rhodanese-related sulfurtransferase